MTTLEKIGPDHPFYSVREINYIKPRGRRISEYEAVICYTHVDLDTGWEAPGGNWKFLGMDGREAVNRANTALHHPDWYEFRDPSRLWQRPYIRHQTYQEHSIEAVMRGAERTGSYAEIDPAWLDPILARYYEGIAFFEWGMSRAFASVVREARCDTLTMTNGFTATDHLRHQQAIALYSLELREQVRNYQDGLGRAAWMEDPVFQPARRLVEDLIACDDWAEVMVVANLLVDPLFAGFAITQFFHRFAPRHGDTISPVICMTAENDRARNRDGTVEFVKMLTADSDRGGRSVPAEQNREILQSWISTWGLQVLEAVDAFAPVFEIPPVQPVKAHDARDQVQSESRALLAEIGLRLPMREREM
jgi:methane monooxygenase component A beta chain/propane monooxygenase small subunit